MRSAVDAINLLNRIKAAADRAQGGKFWANNLVEELAAEGLDVVEREMPAVEPMVNVVDGLVSLRAAE